MTAVLAPSKPTRSARREESSAGLSWLWQNSSLSRVRACRLHPSDADAGVTLRRWSDDTARWSGLQSCGSTWACPVCADGIQAARHADLSAMLKAADSLGLVVGFLTFTVRHKRSQSLREVWDAVSDAWRSMTNGDPRRWNSDRDEFGVVGYVRLWEVTHGGAGWHVHVHALVFLDPAGRTVVKRTPVPLVDHDFVGPLLEGQERRRFRLKVTAAMPRVRHLRGPDGKWTYRRPEGPLPAPVHVPDEREHSLTGPEDVVRIPTGRDLDRLSPVDVEDLAARMFTRWRANLPADMAPPKVCRDTDADCRTRRHNEGKGHTHGYDARLVSSREALAEYFAKNRYKSDASTASDVTSSFRKVARAGNRTPFGILADLVAGTYDGLGDAAALRAHAVDRGLWREWESVSKGRRQLRPSDGLRDFLGLGPEVTDQDAADAANDPVVDHAAADATAPVDLARMSGQGYRRLAFSGMAGFALDLAEAWDLDILDQLLAGHGIHNDDDDIGLARQRAAPN